jgi:hypothetical protein
VKILTDDPPLAQPTCDCQHCECGPSIARWHVQDDIDRHLLHASYTGAAFDSSTGDWQVWSGGKIVGYARTPADAQERAHVCAAESQRHLIQAVT